LLQPAIMRDRRFENEKSNYRQYDRDRRHFACGL
jgi:hypothetical protein